MTPVMRVPLQSVVLMKLCQVLLNKLSNGRVTIMPLPRGVDFVGTKKEETDLSRVLSEWLHEKYR